MSPLQNENINQTFTTEAAERIWTSWQIASTKADWSCHTSVLEVDHIGGVGYTYFHSQSNTQTGFYPQETSAGVKPASHKKHSEELDGKMLITMKLKGQWSLLNKFRSRMVKLSVNADDLVLWASREENNAE